ncbi:MAG: TIGR01777 family oxidoreductase [Bacteroidia bacterium]|nr:TIGR01777 family oxidoreductase [Bacteroidia bacterium]
MVKKKIVIAGGTGFIGQYLSTYFNELGYEIVILSRQTREAQDNINYLQWDGKTLGEWKNSLEGAEALINLAGKSVNCRYTEENKKAILSSRIDSTKVLGQAVAACEIPPKVWLNSSTATIYRHSEAKEMTEEDPIHPENFSENVAQSWEDCFFSFELLPIRQVAMRISIVLGDGSALKPLIKLCRVGLGGAQGKGTQYVSWLHIHDLARMVEYFIHDEGAKGIYNCTSPIPVPNSIFMAELRKSLKTPFGLPAYRWMLEVGAFFLQTEAELILKSRRVIPKRLLEEGFTLTYENVKDAIDEILNSKKNKAQKSMA